MQLFLVRWNLYIQTCQPSRIERESHGFGPNLTHSRKASKISRFGQKPHVFSRKLQEKQTKCSQIQEFENVHFIFPSTQSCFIVKVYEKILHKANGRFMECFARLETSQCWHIDFKHSAQDNKQGTRPFVSIFRNLIWFVYAMTKISAKSLYAFVVSSSFSGCFFMFKIRIDLKSIIF